MDAALLPRFDEPLTEDRKRRLAELFGEVPAPDGGTRDYGWKAIRAALEDARCDGADPARVYAAFFYNERYNRVDRPLPAMEIVVDVKSAVSRPTGAGHPHRR